MYRFSGADGQVIESEPLSVIDVLKSFKQDKGALAGFVNGQEMDLDVILSSDSEVQPITADSKEGLDIIRHSTAHLMAQAVTRLFPGSVVAIGPVIKDGFYYDIEFKEPISESVLPEVEKEMRRIVKKGIPIERKSISRADAIALFTERKDPYKVEILEGIGDDFVNVYWQDEYVDLCRGPHASNTRYLKFFKLLSLAGAYWRGDENNIMLTRIYGTAFASQEDLDDHLNRIEEAKKRDHRKIGKELGIFSLHKEGPGFPFFHPKGMVVINTLVDFWRKIHRENGYDEIKTPLILNRDLWIQSGHWDHYRDNMYFTEIDEQPYAIKPMNCPGGIMVYKSDLHSYRDLPLRLGELGTVHRHEKSGVLHGLMRVRCFTQDDAHHYCTPDQIKDEVSLIMDMVDYIYSDVFGFKYHIELSTRPENSMGSDELWTLAEDSLREVLEKRGVKYILNPGDGAFYGPKIDFHLEDCIGRTWQCGTIQLDFQMPEKFDVTYIGVDGKEHRPAMLHRTILGSLERFLGILIEHYAGAFPFWIAPVQMKILAVGEDHLGYSRELLSSLKKAGYRVELDARDEKLGKKIRDAQMEKVPFMLVVGDKEVEDRSVAVRDRSQGDLGSMSFDALLSHLKGQFSPL